MGTAWSNKEGNGFKDGLVRDFAGEKTAQGRRKSGIAQSFDDIGKQFSPGGAFGTPKDAPPEEMVTGPDGLKYTKSEMERRKLAAAPDVTDAALRQARAAELSKLLSGKGRKSTFLTGPLGEMGGAPASSIGKTKLGGY